MTAGVGQLVRGQRHNAVLSWLLVALVGVAIVTSVARGVLLWAVFALTVVVLVALPPVLLRDWEAMLPWEVTLLAAVPVLGRSFATVPVTGQIATYVSVAALALIVAVELHLFTPVRMTDSFAVALVVVATMATAGVWAVVRWSSDVVLGTTFMLEPGVSHDVIEHALMVEFVASTIAGVVAGLVFTFYVRRRIEPDVRLPEEVPR